MERVSEERKWQAVCEVKLTYSNKQKSSERSKIGSSKDAYTIFAQSWDSDLIELLEEFKILLLNRRNEVLGIFHVSTGGTNITIADPKLIFTAALKANASAIVLAHNHPSGALVPSETDKILTQKLKKGGLLLDIDILDHLILTAEGYFSFANEGVL